MPQKIVTAPDISCGHCVRTIEREVGEIDGVTSVQADETSKRVVVTWQEPTTDWPEIQALLEEIGYPPAGD